MNLIIPESCPRCKNALVFSKRDYYNRAQYSCQIKGIPCHYIFDICYHDNNSMIIKYIQEVIVYDFSRYKETKYNGAETVIIPRDVSKKVIRVFGRLDYQADLDLFVDNFQIL